MAVVIVLSEIRRIENDAHAWVIRRKREATEKSKKPGRVEWVGESYHSRLSDALKYALDNELSDERCLDSAGRVLSAVREFERRVLLAIANAGLHNDFAKARAQESSHE